MVIASPQLSTTSRVESCVPPQPDTPVAVPFAFLGYGVGISLVQVDRQEFRLSVFAPARRDEVFRGFPALPGGFLTPELDNGVHRLGTRDVAEFQFAMRSGTKAFSCEALPCREAVGRDPRETSALVAGRMRTIAQPYLILSSLGRGSGWRDVYDFLPWEDQRSEEGRQIAAQLGGAVALAEPERASLAATLFGLDGQLWDHRRAAERFAALFETGLVYEAHRGGRNVSYESGGVGVSMAFDHRAMLADALSAIRFGMCARPAVLQALFPKSFSFADARRWIEILLGQPVDSPNLRKRLTRLQDRSMFHLTGADTGPAGRQGGRPSQICSFGPDAGHILFDPPITYPVVRP